MLDIEGTELNQKDIERLSHPQVGGLILFSRNYSDRPQLISLIKHIRQIRPEILIAVDHEGGRVQRFLEGFTHIPAMGDILPLVNNHIEQAQRVATELGFLMAIELLACDIDLSFAPVLDLNGISKVIGKRSFSPNPSEVSVLASAFIDGMKQAGMQSVGKHFPGHGSVGPDSHIAMPVDDRSWDEVESCDMQPFSELISAKQLDGVMPAHVVYSKIDDNPAGFSSFWLQDILRQKLAFSGVIFSDDLGMKGASFAGDYCARALAALDAGCDMILLCNDSDGLDELLNHFDWPEKGPRHSALSLKADPVQVAKALEQAERWQKGVELVRKLAS